MFGNGIQMVGYILLALIAFGMLVFFHELGHFTLAKIHGVFVEEFSIGMGPKLFGIKGKETMYSIRILPIGGYVKMIGEEGASNDPRSFANKKAWQRLTIIAAGPIMNVILALVLFGIISFNLGVPSLVIKDFTPGSPAKAAGVMAGDKLVKVNGSTITDWDNTTQLIGNSEGKVVNVEVLRNGESKTIAITPASDAEAKRYVIGIYPEVVNPTFKQATSYAVDKFNFIFKQTFGFFGKLFHGQVSKNDVGGPISIINVSVAAAKAGLVNLLFLAALLSVQLAIFNVIPFPALDGGWIFLLIVEMITGKKFNEDTVGKINYIGFVFLMLLMILVTVKDILYPLKF